VADATELYRAVVKRALNPPPTPEPKSTLPDYDVAEQSLELGRSVWINRLALAGVIPRLARDRDRSGYAINEDLSRMVD
jgi:hypothetical protein